MTARISTAQTYYVSEKNVERAHERSAETFEKASSLKEVRKASDNPLGYTLITQMKNDLKATDGMTQNASLGKNALALTDGALAQIQEAVQRAHELAVSASSDTQTSRTQMVGEARALYDSVVQSLNTRLGDRYLFSGFQGQRPAFTPEGVFQGDSSALRIEIEPQHFVSINPDTPKLILGQEGAEKTGVNILGSLQQFVVGLAHDDVSMIRGTLDDLMKANDQLSLGRSEIGSALQAIDRSNQNESVRQTDEREALSKIEEADAAKVFSQMSRDAAALKAALASSEKFLSNSPVDILFR